MTKHEFIEKIAKYVIKYNDKNYSNSAIIAQACLESGYGTSTLSSRYFNHFGLKCGSSWKGGQYNAKTQEYIEGTYVTLTDNFRTYAAFEDGVKGYFDFIKYARYSNLVGVNNPEEYLIKIVNDGYCTDPRYIDKCITIINSFNLKQYDGKEFVEGKYELSIDKIVTIANEVIQGKYGNGSERINNLLNCGYTEIEIKRIQSVVNSILSEERLVNEVIQGKFGNGSERKEKLEKEGFSYDYIQSKVNAKLK